MVNIRTELKALWNASAVLTATGLLMLAITGVFAVGLVLDPQTVTGAPAWLKPLKFGISTAVFSLTVAWLFRYLSSWRRFVRFLGWTISAVFIVEVAIIALQASRGVPSHFHVATPFDAALFSIMGVSIGILWLASVGLLAALIHQRFGDPAWGNWLRSAMFVSVLGSAAGGLMLGMTAEQRTAREAGQRLQMVGGHTVGAPDGGPGLPVTGWSTNHGDLRIAHFIGLHAIQILPLIGFTLRRKRTEVRQRLAFVAAGSYLGFAVIFAWQALRGQSILSPDALTLTALGLWACGTAVAATLSRGVFPVQQPAEGVRG